jgi:hypothetical protein
MRAHAAPVTHLVESPNAGRIIAFPRVGGLHRRYSRARVTSAARRRFHHDSWISVSTQLQSALRHSQ